MTTLAALDSLIASKSLLLHPFYVRWSKGELTREELSVYAKEYYHLVTHIPGIVARVRDRAPTMEKRTEIEQNIIEETEHIALWERFALSMGISREELLAYVPSVEVMTAVRALEELAEGSYEDGVVGMYALERELPAIAQTKKEGLERYYGLTSEDAHIYFDEHLGEEKHLAVWRDIEVADLPATAAATTSLTAQNRVLDAVCHASGIPLHC